MVIEDSTNSVVTFLTLTKNSNSSLCVITLTWYHKVINFQQSLKVVLEGKICSNNRMKAEEFSFNAHTLSSSASEEEKIQGSDE